MPSLIYEPIWSGGESKLLNSIGIKNPTPSFSFGRSILHHAVQPDFDGDQTLAGWSRDKFAPWTQDSAGWDAGPWDHL